MIESENWELCTLQAIRFETVTKESFQTRQSGFSNNLDIDLSGSM